MQVNKYFKQQGSAAIIVLVVVIVLAIVGASVISYYVLQSQGKAPTVYDTSYRTLSPMASTAPTNLTTTVSDDDNVDTIEAEFNGTVSDDIDADMETLNSSASSL